MPLTATDLITLSRLLDEAMDLEPARAEAWLSALPEEHAHLRPKLREMLTAHLANSNPGFMVDGPKLAGDPVDETVARADELIGPYRLIREIGRGGMGAVWLAERADGTLKRHVALKLPRLAWGAGLADRMARERDIGALLAHPNIARLYDAGVDALGRPYLALEYIDGQPLDAWCEAQALSVRDRLQVFVQVTRAVAYAHGRLVVHRDLKPSNVLVTADGQAHLLDFGIAKLLHEAAPGDDQLTQEQGRVLTPHYASPEQIRGETITVASDVYSLGVLLYELLTARYPYEPERKSVAAIEEAILNDEPPLASSRAQDKTTVKALRGEIDAILVKTLKREPGQRYPTADALAEDIERHLKGEAVLARPDSLGYRLGKAMRRHRVSFGAAAAVLAAVLGGAAMATVQAQRASDAAERARVVKEFVVDVFKVNERNSPGNAELRQLPAESLLERGAKLIEVKFPGQPMLQAELYGVVGGIFADMANPKLAAEYATKQVDVLSAVGASPLEQSTALVLLAQALSSEGRLTEADSRARRAVDLSTSDPLASVRGRLVLAQILFDRAMYAETTSELNLIDQALSKMKGALTIEQARVTFLRAELLDRDGQFNAAVAKYEQAIDEAIHVEGLHSRGVIAMRLRFVGELVQERRMKETKIHLAAALDAMRALGGADDVEAASAEARQAGVFLNYGFMPPDEALAIIERSRATIYALGLRAPEAVRARIDFTLGKALLDRGEISRAHALLSKAVPVLRASTESPKELRILGVGLGTALEESGRHAEADVELRRSLEYRRRESGSNPMMMASGYRFVAINLREQGRFDEAEFMLRSAPNLDDIRDPSKGTAQMAAVLASERALVAFERGDAALALRLLAKYDDKSDFDPAFGVENPSLVRAACRCTVGQAREALPLMELFTSQIAETSYVHSPELAQLRAWTGLCALKAGNRRRAAELAAQAKTAFVEQPEVSPYYKVPLLKLERALSVRSPVEQRGSD